MSDAVASLVSSIPYFFALGFGLGMSVGFVCWGISKCWSLIHIVE